MKIVIHLQSFDNQTIIDNLAGFSSLQGVQPDILSAAIAHQKKDDLRYNIRTGEIRCNSLGLLSRYCHKSDIPVNPTNEDVIQWQFGGQILNSISRIQRGLSA